jgi:hypothetical protein
MHTSAHHNSIAADLVKGALAGVVATWVMGKATTWMYEQESQAVREREDAARNGKSAYAIAANKAADMSGIALTEEQQKQAGSAIHWAIGIAAGATYGMMRRRHPSLLSHPDRAMCADLPNSFALYEKEKAFDIAHSNLRSFGDVAISRMFCLPYFAVHAHESARTESGQRFPALAHYPPLGRL